MGRMQRSTRRTYCCCFPRNLYSTDTNSPNPTAVKMALFLPEAAINGTKTEFSVPGVKLAVNGSNIRNIALATLIICCAVLIVIIGSGLLYITII